MSDRVLLIVDGSPVDARPGESVAAALLRHGIRTLHRSPSGEPRGLFCGIGLCHDCYATVDGRPHVRTCMTIAREGLRVETGS